jgi:hypothetical protein
MIDLKRQLEFFNPIQLTDDIHIIGVGAVGSHIFETLVRMGVNNINIYDFDTIDPHNLANQQYFFEDIGTSKVLAMDRLGKSINPELHTRLFEEGYQPGMSLDGYIFLAVDNIDLRREIVKEHRFNTMIKAMFDFRMGLEEAQHFAADWSNKDHIERFLATMNFTHEEAKESMPVSACGTTLSVITTIKVLSSVGISNWMNFIKKNELHTAFQSNCFAPYIDIL